MGAPVSDNEARSAVHAIGGYAYQLMCTAVAWIDLEPGASLYVEVAEDYATAVKERMEAVQVKRTADIITLRSKAVVEALNNFWALKQKNPVRQVSLRYLTTSVIGREQKSGLPGDVPGLMYWRAAARQVGDVAPLKALLLTLPLSAELRKFLDGASDADVREHLLRRVHWDVDQPSLQELRRQAEAKLVQRGRSLVVGTTVAELTAILDPMLARILEIASKGADRVLDSVELDGVIEARTHTPVPNPVLRQLLAAPVSSAGVQSPDRIFDAGDRPLPLPVAERTALVDDLKAKLTEHGWLVLQGGTGLGKSTLARLLARRLGGKWPLIDLRGAEADKARLRLEQCLAQIRSGTAGIILDDLPVQLDAEIEDALSLVFGAARESDCLVVVTCSRVPSDRLLSFASGNAVVRAPNLDEADVGQLVAALGGDAETWGPVSHTVCGSGNPQLVHARLKRLARQGWPATDLLAGIDPRLPVSGAEDERTAARRRLQNEVDEPSRGLLYRLSVIGGYFDRRLALELGKLAPSLAQPGEVLDWLVGPWIEDLGRGYYRLSPLLSGAAKDVVTASEFKSIQHAIVDNLLSRRPLIGNLLSTAFLHAFASAHEPGLMMLAALPITAEESKKRYVAQELMALKYLRIDRPLFDRNPYLAVLLRFAQFYVFVEFEEWKQVNECFAQLIKEAAELGIAELGSGFEMIALWAGLGEQRLPERLPNWLKLTLRVKELLRSGKGRVLADAQARAEQLDDAEGLAMHQILFVMNAIKNPTVASLHSVFKELDDLPAPDRDDLLAGFEGKLANTRLFTGNAWFADQKRKGFDPKIAAALYADMVTRAGRWGNRSLTIDCLVAQSVILDEYGLDEQSALAVLEEGEKSFGAHVELTRQRAKVLHRAGRNDEASTLYAAIAQQLPADDLVEQAFAMREAAISAARLGNWNSSIAYYQRAIDAASRGGDDMTIMATGLMADLAWAQANLNQVQNAVSTLKEALARIKPYHLDRSELEHCARLLVGGVVGNIDQWLATTDDTSRKKFEVAFGICSRLEPIQTLLDRKPHPIEVDWYKLALLELRHTDERSITKEIDGWPSERRIGSFESLMAKERIEQSVRHLDLSRFVQELKPYAASMLALRDAAGRPGNVDGLLAHGRPRELVAADVSDAIAVSSIQNAVLAFAVQAVSNKQGQLVAELGRRLSSELSDMPALEPLVDALSGRSMTNDRSQGLIASRLDLLATRWEDLSPGEVLEAQCRIVDSMRQNELKGAVAASVGRWVVETWRDMTTERRFQLRMPMRTCPAIEQACEGTESGLGCAGRVLLAAEDATSVELSPEFRDLLARL